MKESWNEAINNHNNHDELHHPGFKKEDFVHNWGKAFTEENIIQESCHMMLQ
jgi:hypothetical protein